jgi:hypothetical protein
MPATRHPHESIHPARPIDAYEPWKQHYDERWEWGALLDDEDKSVQVCEHTKDDFGGNTANSRQFSF